MNPKLMIVSSDPATLGFLRGHLTARRFEFRVCGRAAEASDILANDKIRIAFVDLDDTNQDGLEMIRSIKDHDGTIQIIAMTTASKLVQAVQAFKLGVSDYILNPMDNPERIDHAIWLCLEKFKWWAEIFQEVARQQAEADQAQPAGQAG